MNEIVGIQRSADVSRTMARWTTQVRRYRRWVCVWWLGIRTKQGINISFLSQWSSRSLHRGVSFVNVAIQCGELIPWWKRNPNRTASLKHYRALQFIHLKHDISYHTFYMSEHSVGWRKPTPCKLLPRASLKENRESITEKNLHRLIHKNLFLLTAGAEISSAKVFLAQLEEHDENRKRKTFLLLFYVIMSSARRREEKFLVHGGGVGRQSWSFSRVFTPLSCLVMTNITCICIRKCTLNPLRDLQNFFFLSRFVEIRKKSNGVKLCLCNKFSAVTVRGKTFLSVILQKELAMFLRFVLVKSEKEREWGTFWRVEA